ncbi:head decoration protein [Thalassospira sp.]|uniref:head decoration protein n=1 Tax=Thalassospira sp. TaxID=1912094 RepID=UPI003AA7C275
MTTYLQAPQDGAFLMREVDWAFRETGTLKAGQVYHPGTVLAQQGLADNVVVAADGGNTGNGTIDDATVVTGKAAVLGAYVLTALDATHFSVTTPNGNNLKNAVVGTEYASTHLSGFTITAGGTAFEAGDILTVTVAAGTGDFVALDPAKDDGSQIAKAILFSGQNAKDSAQKAVLVTRLATVDGNRLIWPEGITADQKTAAIASLATNHLLVK